MPTLISLPEVASSLFFAWNVLSCWLVSFSPAVPCAPPYPFIKCFFFHDPVYFFSIKIFFFLIGTSLVVQCLRIHLPMWETWVQSLVQENSTCHRATKPMCHNYWAHALQQEKLSGMRNPQSATKSSLYSLQLEKAYMQHGKPSTAKNKYIYK